MKQPYLPLIVFFLVLGKAYSQSIDFADIQIKQITSDESITWQQFGPGMSGFSTSAYWHPTLPDVLYSSPNMGNSYVSFDRGFSYQTIMDADGSGHKTDSKGPRIMHTPDFSRQNPAFGMCATQRTMGLWVTQDTGRTWIKAPGKMEQINIGGIAVHPQDDNIWYVGAGKMSDPNKSYFTQAKPHGTNSDASYEGKIWRTENKGQSWTMINAGLHSKAQVIKIIADPVTPSTIYLATTYGFYKSTDEGQNWVKKKIDIDNGVIRSMDIHHDKATDKITLFLIENITYEADGTTVKNGTGGVFKSKDGGDTWKNITGNLQVDLSKIAISKGSFYTALGVFFGKKSSELEALYPDLPTSITSNVEKIRVDPNNVNRLYLVNKYKGSKSCAFAPGDLWRSDDGGKNWYVTIRNGNAWEGKDKEYWEARNQPISQNINFAFQHHWKLRDQYDRKAGTICEINADCSTIMVQRAKMFMMSEDFGDTWTENDEKLTSNGNWVGSGNSNMPGHGFYQDIRVSGVFACSGENALWRTTEDGDEIRKGALAVKNIRLVENEQSVSTIAIHPNDTSIWYGLFFRQDHHGEIIKTTDGGKTFTSIGEPIPKPWPSGSGGDESIHQFNLIIDPVNPDNMYFCVPKNTLDNNWVGDAVGGWGIYRSKDGGVTWDNPHSGLPSSLDVTSLRFDPNNPKTLYATVYGKDGGLYITTNRGNSWAEVESTKALSAEGGVNDIFFAKNDKVYISTGGNKIDKNVGALYVSDLSMTTWTKIFSHPWVNKVRVAEWNTDVILISTNAHNATDFINPGLYLSRDGGQNWIKINKGHGHSDRINDIHIDMIKKGRYFASSFGSGFHFTMDPYFQETTPVATQTINLKAGWNLVSLYVVPDNSLIGTVFPNAEVVKTFDAFYSSADPDYLNSLQKIKAGEGYLVYNTKDETIILTGLETHGRASLLTEGWNLVGVPINENFKAAGFPTETEIVKDFDEFYETGNGLNTLKKLKPGKAYFIKVQADCVIEFK